ncbi:MAG: Calx-beta domain-containing protein, partial [Alphaproteobacteria bacterium]
MSETQGVARSIQAEVKSTANQAEGAQAKQTAALQPDSGGSGAAPMLDGQPVLVLEKPESVQAVSLAWTPGTALVTAFNIGEVQVSVETDATVFTWTDGAQLKVVGLDEEAYGDDEVPVQLEDGTVLSLEELATIMGVEPAAGAQAGGNSPGNQGHSSFSSDPGTIGSGFDDTGALGYTDLAFSVPELTEDTDPLELAPQAAPVIVVTVDSVTVTEGDPIEGNGGEGQLSLFSEGGLQDDPTTTITFTITLSAPGTEAVTVDYQVSDGSAVLGNPDAPEGDYSPLDALSGTVTFAPGEVTKTVTLNIVDDFTFEPTEQFTIQLSSPVGAVLGDSGDGLGTGVGTILDNDAVPSLYIGDAVAYEGDDLVFGLFLSNPSYETIVVSLQTGGGTATEGGDYASGDGTLVTFLAGQTFASVTLSSFEDNVFEADESFTVSASAVSGSVDTSATGTGTILNDDAVPSLIIGDATAIEGDVLSFELTLSNPSAETIVVSLDTGAGSATEGADYTSIDGQLVTFAAGQTAATVTVQSGEDNVFEGAESFSVSATAVSGSVGTFDSGTGTILDNETTPTLSIGDATAIEGNVLVFDLTLPNPSAEEIVILVNTESGSATEGADFATIDGQFVTFAPGQTVATVSMTSTEDNIFEGSETFTVSTTAVSGSVHAGDAGTGTILDNDAAPTLTISDESVTEGGSLVFDLTLSNPSAEEIVVLVNTNSGTATEGTDFTDVINQAVTFAAGQTAATVTVQSSQDNVHE